MNFVSTSKEESKTCPGVFYTLYKMSEARRAQLRLLIAEPTAKIRNLLREMTALEDRHPVTEENPNRPEEVIDELLRLSDKMEQISSDEINPKWLKWGLKKIEGLQIDDQEATPDMLTADGPPSLFQEIVDRIKRLAQLNGEEEKNFESPTTSGEPTGGETTNTSAVGASSSDSTPLETATSISQS